MNIAHEIRRLLADMIPIETTITDDTNLRNDLGIDSYGCVEVIVKIEDKLGVTFMPSQLNIARLQTVSDFIKITEEAVKTNVI